jgi:hypothetical protein
MDTAEPQKLGFEKDIKPLFRDRDRGSMRRFFDLWEYTDVVANGEAIAERLADGSMPCDGAWPAQKVELFRRWLDEGAAD